MKANYAQPQTVRSLMWLPGQVKAANTANLAWENDLGLNDLVKAFAVDPRYVAFIRQTLATLNIDPAVIAWRQAVLDDFLSTPALVDSVQALLPRLANLRYGTVMLGQRRRSLLLETSDRVAELDLLSAAVVDLRQALSQVNLASEGLRGLKADLEAIMDNTTFKALREQLPELRAPIQSIASITVGINMDSQLRPLSAVLLSINERPFGEPASFLDRLLGVEAEPESGIAPLHYTPRDPDERPLSPLFQDMDRLLSQIAGPVARALRRYVQIHVGLLGTLENELAFFCAAISMLHKLEAAKIAFCRPEVAAKEDRVSTVEGLANLHLVLRGSNPVVSDVKLDESGRIGILTGPNSGGKTTYIQALGLAHVLFQAGLPVPARSARLSPVDAILTHFPAPETRQLGRLAEEAARLRELFHRATRYSLVLLNESLSSTTLGEALYLAQDVLAGLRAIGVRGIYATHLIELAERIAEIEALAEGDSSLYSLVAGISISDAGEAAPTYQISPGLPLDRSYAREIARRHGITLQQILDGRDSSGTPSSPS